MLKFYNTLSRKKEVFRPLKKGRINLFVCGPTVYDFPHLGHARTYISFDMIVKYLRHQGYKVFYLQNITDIDDKIIKRAKEKKKSWLQIARFFEKEYYKGMKSLKVDSITKYARATDYIKEIQSQVKRLLKKGYGYSIKDGIYYDIKRFKDYGKLSRRTALGTEDAISRIDESKEKRNKGDFCLWKFRKAGEQSWPSPWNNGGRPGWHIEDTAITEKHFGYCYDIHGGARDLIFPHHEAEIAQMQAISGKKPLVRYWLHTGFLTIKGRKMSKSLGNFITLKDFFNKWSSRERSRATEILRFIIFSSHYRSPFDYSPNLAKEAEANLKRLEEFLNRLRGVRNSLKESHKKLIENFEEKFLNSLENDFNTPKAKALIFDFIASVNKKIEEGKISKKEARKIYRFFKEINEIFGILDFKKIEKKKIVPEKIRKLIELREKMRTQKKWEEADELRRKIQKLGYKIKDTKDGPKVSGLI